MHSTTRLVSAGVGGIIPTDLANLEAWYRFNVGITSDAQGVSQWDDQSGNANHLLQATDTNKPSEESDGSILFDGVDNYLQTGSLTSTTNYSAYCLFNQVTSTGDDGVLDFSATGNPGIFQGPSNGDLHSFSTTTGADNSELAVGVYGVVSLIVIGTRFSLRINNGSATEDTLTSNAVSELTLGVRTDASTQFGNIQVKEVVVYNITHNSKEISQVIDYLSDVGGLNL